MSILEILEAHTVKRPWSEASRMRCKCGETVTAETEGQLYALHRAHLAQVLEEHEREAKAEAVRESSRYLNHIMPNGLVNPIAVLADLDVAADRIGNGLHANGRDRNPS